MIIAAVITAVAAIGAAAIGVTNRRKLNEIHVLVNSRLDQALVQIEDLKWQRNRLQNIEDGTSPPGVTHDKT
jgi:hypothetical protein